LGLFIFPCVYSIVLIWWEKFVKNYIYSLIFIFIFILKKLGFSIFKILCDLGHLLIKMFEFKTPTQTSFCLLRILQVSKVHLIQTQNLTPNLFLFLKKIKRRLQTNL